MPAKILLIDDDHEYRAVLVMALELQGYVIRQAAGGQKAMDMIRCEPPDIIISDLEMFGMDGHALLRSVRGIPEYAAIPFVILSAVHQPLEPSDPLVRPADCYVSKQLPVAQLVQLIEHFLGASPETAVPPLN